MQKSRKEYKECEPLSGLQGVHAIGLHVDVSSVALEDVLIILLNDNQGQ